MYVPTKTLSPFLFKKNWPDGFPLQEYVWELVPGKPVSAYGGSHSKGCKLFMLMLIPHCVHYPCWPFTTIKHNGIINMVL